MGKKNTLFQCECTNLLLGSKPVQRNNLYILKNFKIAHALRVTETKITLWNVFILDLSALGGETESK